LINYLNFAQFTHITMHYINIKWRFTINSNKRMSSPPRVRQAPQVNSTESPAAAEAEIAASPTVDVIFVSNSTHEYTAPEVVEDVQKEVEIVVEPSVVVEPPVEEQPEEKHEVCQPIVATPKKVRFGKATKLC